MKYAPQVVITGNLTNHSVFILDPGNVLSGVYKTTGVAQPTDLATSSGVRHLEYLIRSGRVVSKRKTPTVLAGVYIFAHDTISKCRSKLAAITNGGDEPSLIHSYMFNVDVEYTTPFNPEMRVSIDDVILQREDISLSRIIPDFYNGIILQYSMLSSSKFNPVYNPFFRRPTMLDSHTADLETVYLNRLLDIQIPEVSKSTGGLIKSIMNIKAINSTVLTNMYIDYPGSKYLLMILPDHIFFHGDSIGVLEQIEKLNDVYTEPFQTVIILDNIICTHTQIIYLDDDLFEVLKIVRNYKLVTVQTDVSSQRKTAK